jgi:RNA recognition motif-containing protein
MQNKNAINETQPPKAENIEMEIEELDQEQKEDEEHVTVQPQKKDVKPKAKKPVADKNANNEKTDNGEAEASVITRKHDKTPEQRMRELQATVFVQNLDFDLTEDAFYRHFRKLGYVKQAKVN